MATDTDVILQLLLWGGLLFVMMRFGCGSHLFGHGHAHSHARGHNAADQPQAGHVGTSPSNSEELVWTAPDQDKDPVCGKEIRTAGAKSSVHDGWVYYFCSRECREAFEAAPETYLTAWKRISRT